MTTNSNWHVKVCLVGETRVGKTSLVVRFIDKTFDQVNSKSTIGASYRTKRVILNKSDVDVVKKDSNIEKTHIDNGKNVGDVDGGKMDVGKNDGGADDGSCCYELVYNIWDTAGQEKYSSLMKLYYRGSTVVIIVYDVTDSKSFHEVDFWIKEVKSHLPESTVIYVVVGNKIDSIDDRQVPTCTGKEYADSIGAIFFEVSAKTSDNVDAMFDEISKQLLLMNRANRLQGNKNGGFHAYQTVSESNASSCCKL